MRTQAERVEQGLLGDHADWIAAETRWRTQGLTEEDWTALSDERWLFDAQIATVGYPLSAKGWTMAHAARLSIQSFIYKRYTAARGAQARNTWANLCLYTLWPSDDKGNEVPAELQDAAVWRQILGDAATFRLQASWLPYIFNGKTLNDQEIELLDWMGRQSRSFAFDDENHIWDLTDQLAEAYRAQPTRLGLLPILGISTLENFEVCPTPVSIFPRLRYESPVNDSE